MASIPPTHTPFAPTRWLALDVFRALAVLWMIQGHTFTALLGTADPFEGGLGQLYRLLHGLTAPMFLCGAGLAYGIVNFNPHKPVVPGRSSRRALLLLAIGTVLQLPAAPLWSLVTSPEQLRPALQPGALQLVAACLILAELLRAASSGRARRFAGLAALIGVSVALVSPWVWGFELSSRYVLGSWLDGQTGAQFPLLPWLSFFLLGAALSSFCGARLWREPRSMPLIAAIAFGASALCYGLFLAGERLNAVYGAHAFWLTNPMFVVFRAGLVLTWLGVLSAASGCIARTLASFPGTGRIISALSRHSLIAYVVHLSMLYGLPLQRGSQAPYNLLECSVVCAVVLSISVLCTLHWERARAALRALATWLGSDRPAAENLGTQLAPPRDPLV